MSDQLPPPLPGDGPPPPAPPPVPSPTRPPLTPPPAARPASTQPPPTQPAPEVVSADAPLSATCPNCGAQTAYAPGTTVLRCGSCGAERTIADSSVQIREHSFDEWTQKYHDLDVAGIATNVLQCRNCGATTETTDYSGVCQFCAGALVTTNLPEGLVTPEAVVPFHVDRNGARDHFRSWVGSRWFAPNALKKVGSADGLAGTYVPHWTFDAQTETDYTGQRGEHYYTTETRTVSDGRGGTRTETYQQQHTRWYPASGHVSRFFDDVLVPGSRTLDAKRLAKMGPWTLTDAVAYRPDYLTGYSALRYDLDPEDAGVDARAQMNPVVEGDARRDIGGDEQRVSSLDISYQRATFKLMLLPLWIATYLFAGKTFQVMVNANTGEVVGERPFSVLKIVAAVVAALVVIGVVVAVVVASRGSS